MKRILLTILSMMALATASWAVKANPQPITVTQPDGTQVTVLLHGDEDFSWYTDLHGNLLQRVGNQFTPVLTDAATFFRQAEQLRAANQARRIPIGTDSPNYFPHVGTPKALVILVEFSDTTFAASDPKAAFEQYLNGDAQTDAFNINATRNYGSVAKYFSDMSGGQFKPQFDIVGPVRLSKSISYYGKDANGSHDINLKDMMREACEAVDDQVDFSQYDSDGDGFVDLVYFIYAGYSQSNGAPADASIWPRSGSSTVIARLDGKRIMRYGVNNELNYYPGYKFQTNPEIAKRMNGIGLFCHEFSHTMGLPDLYPTVASAQIDNQGLEYWDLMDGGEYVDNGYTPTPYTPWEKDVMGWASLRELGDEAAQVRLADGESYKVSLPNSSEYLILHNVQNTGWGSKLLGHGMMVYRIDYPNELVKASDRPNNTAGKPAVTIVPADGLLISSYSVRTDARPNAPYTQEEYYNSHYGDPYPGANHVTSLLSVQMNETTAEKPLYNIAEQNGVVTFDYLKDITSSIAAPVVAQAQAEVYTLDGRKVATPASQLAKGIYIVNGKKVVVK